ncbi:hypothetical protein [Membranihabitans marinus]|uniref:hypothetical protein n=1 Tax=Membranihabitans marinus TaxID=1227546 RepID=UPI001F4803EA|nr:hypothetical protein [Membranihabitans marinus]
MKFDEAKNTGIAVATASILNDVKLLINRKITVNYKCNSYNFQINAQLHYDFTSFFEGLNVELLYVWKENIGSDLTQWADQSSNYHQINLKTNFNF